MAALAAALTGPPAVLAQGVALLERAMGYTLGSLQLVTPQSLDNPTPCREWDLRALLLHMNDSLLTLHQAIAACTRSKRLSASSARRRPPGTGVNGTAATALG